MSEETTLNVKGLDQLLRALKAKPPVARVGILGSKSTRSKNKGNQNPTNAEIGAVHEFGSPARNIPARSFLRIPISENLEKYMERAGLFNEGTLKEVIKNKSLVPWTKTVAVLAEEIVGDAFDTHGFGNWEPWRNSSYTNNTGDLLVDTQQLRNSITHEVKE